MLLKIFIFFFFICNCFLWIHWIWLNEKFNKNYSHSSSQWQLLLFSVQNWFLIRIKMTKKMRISHHEQIGMANRAFEATIKLVDLHFIYFILLKRTHWFGFKNDILSFLLLSINFQINCKMEHCESICAF